MRIKRFTANARNKRAGYWHMRAKASLYSLGKNMLKALPDELLLEEEDKHVRR